jgi:hypothetical protein
MGHLLKALCAHEKAITPRRRSHLAIPSTRGWTKNIGLDVSIIGKQARRQNDTISVSWSESNGKHMGREGECGSTRECERKSISLFYLLEIYIVLGERARGDNRLSSRKREDVMCRLSGFIVLTEANWLSEMDHKSIRGVV